MVWPPPRRTTRNAASTATATSKQPNSCHSVNAINPRVNKEASNNNQKNELDHSSDDESEVGSSDVKHQVTLKRTV